MPSDMAALLKIISPTCAHSAITIPTNGAAAFKPISTLQQDSCSDVLLMNEIHTLNQYSDKLFGPPCPYHEDPVWHFVPCG